uniref:Uncharacterized protein n=1 Tax=Nelumbo nucifera TaxID=4432 RepID=A0A822Y1N1_NELNU|nr:TPA_asm: hypothetical protein HUJ06_027630 [Nelumbo nucifera]
MVRTQRRKYNQWIPPHPTPCFCLLLVSKDTSNAMHYAIQLIYIYIYICDGPSSMLRRVLGVCLA